MKKELRSISIWLSVFIVVLLLNGVTAFAIETELRWLLSPGWRRHDALYNRISQSYVAIQTTNANFPPIAYGYDWLAFVHIVIAVFFLGPLKDPLRNIWVIKSGCIASLMIFPLAFIAGPIRQIPLFRQLPDCSFGVIGLVPLLICYRKTYLLEVKRSTNTIISHPL